MFSSPAHLRYRFGMFLIYTDNKMDYLTKKLCF